MRADSAYQRVIALETNVARVTPPPDAGVAMLRRAVLHDGVRHRRQRYDWDCGLACVQMVLPEREARRLEDEFHAVCREEGFAKSTWTIDLCYVLRRYNRPHAFHTLTLGAHAGFRTASFYSSVFAKDEARVNLRFAEAEVSGLEVRRSALTLADILARLRRGPAIVLTDASRLECGVCKRNRLATELRKCLPIPLPPPPYVGHYVVLCGYDLGTRRVFYRNPACHNHYCVMSMETFEDSRRAFGTDEDIVFVEGTRPEVTS